MSKIKDLLALINNVVARQMARRQHRLFKNKSTLALIKRLQYLCYPLKPLQPVSIGWYRADVAPYIVKPRTVSKRSPAIYAGSHDTNDNYSVRTVFLLLLHAAATIANARCPFALPPKSDIGEFPQDMQAEIPHA